MSRDILKKIAASKYFKEDSLGLSFQIKILSSKTGSKDGLLRFARNDGGGMAIQLSGRGS